MPRQRISPFSARSDSSAFYMISPSYSSENTKVLERIFVVLRFFLRFQRAFLKSAFGLNGIFIQQASPCVTNHTNTTRYSIAYNLSLLFWEYIVFKYLSHQPCCWRHGWRHTDRCAPLSTVCLTRNTQTPHSHVHIVWREICSPEEVLNKVQTDFFFSSHLRL